MKQKWSSVFLLNFLSLCCTAQMAGYKYYCLLDSVKSPGFYSIRLTPEINAHIKTDYSDLRIVNKDGRWVPHLFIFPVSRRISEGVLSDLKFSIIENSKINTVIIVEPAKDILSNIVLTIKNTEAKRYCTLSGSDDKKDWFVINDSILLNTVIEENAVTSRIQINFPPSSYKYLKVIIHNSNRDPFRITNLTEYKLALSKFENKLIQNPAPIVIQKDSGKISYLKIDQQQAYHFDNISLKVSGSKYYYRKADLYIPDTSNNSFSKPGVLINSFTISNNSTLQFKVPVSNAPFFYLLINNEDNLPLSITEINTAYTYDCFTTYLEKGGGYKLIMGNEFAKKPDYDLSNFNKIIPDSTAFLSTGKIQSFDQKMSIAVPVKNMKWLLWIAITIALVILLFFTQKMIREVDKTKHNDSL